MDRKKKKASQRYQSSVDSMWNASHEATKSDMAKSPQEFSEEL